ncbi:hypothetical protein P7C73_g3596, partial [Tremellales sp. Uapishka_1]
MQTQFNRKKLTTSITGQGISTPPSVAPDFGLITSPSTIVKDAGPDTGGLLSAQSQRRQMADEKINNATASLAQRLEELARAHGKGTLESTVSCAKQRSRQTYTARMTLRPLAAPPIASQHCHSLSRVSSRVSDASRPQRTSPPPLPSPFAFRWLSKHTKPLPSPPHTERPSVSHQNSVTSRSRAQSTRAPPSSYFPRKNSEVSLTATTNSLCLPLSVMHHDTTPAWISDKATIKEVREELEINEREARRLIKGFERLEERIKEKLIRLGAWVATGAELSFTDEAEDDGIKAETASRRSSLNALLKKASSPFAKGVTSNVVRSDSLKSKQSISTIGTARTTPSRPYHSHMRPAVSAQTMPNLREGHTMHYKSLTRIPSLNKLPSSHPFRSGNLPSLSSETTTTGVGEDLAVEIARKELQDVSQRRATVEAKYRYRIEYLRGRLVAAELRRKARK